MTPGLEGRSGEGVKGLWLALLALAGLLLGAGLQQRYDTTVRYFGDRDAFVSLPAGRTIKTLSFGYHNLAADLLFIWSIQFYSTPQIRNRFEFLERVFAAITDITPSYRDPYIVGAMIMVFEAQDVRMALRLLEKGARYNPDEWRFEQEAGFYAFKYLKDYSLAERYYSRAAAKPDAPVYVKRWNAHLVYLRDDPALATRMWLDIYRNAQDTLTRDSAFNHLYQIKAEADLPKLQGQVQEYRRRFRRLPAALADLAASGLAPELPRDFAGKPYLYDPGSGRVTAQRIFNWKKKR